MVPRHALAVTDRVNITSGAAPGTAPTVRCRLVTTATQLQFLFGNPNPCAIVSLQPYTSPATTPPPDWVTTSTLHETGGKFPDQVYAGARGGRLSVCPTADATYIFQGRTTSVQGLTRDCDNTLDIQATTPPPPSCTLTATNARFQCFSIAQHPRLTLTLRGQGGPITRATIDSWPVRVTSTTNYYNIPLPGRSVHTFTARLTGPGGTSTCQASAGFQCIAQTAFYEAACCPEGSLTYIWPKSNPPACTWQARNTATGQYIADRGCSPGCFAPETEMWMGDGSKKLASLVKVGDWLWNPLLRQPKLVKKVIAGPEEFPLVEIGYGKFRVRVSAKHPFITRNGVRPAELITTADAIQGTDRRFHRVTVAHRLPWRKGQVVYNFEMHGDSEDISDHVIVGDGIATGDHFIQTELERGRLP